MSEQTEQDIKDYCDHIEKLQGGGPMLGATLRDYFAAKAMHAAIESQLHDGGDVPEENIPKFFELVAGYAYIAADAMLAERAK